MVFGVVLNQKVPRIETYWSGDEEEVVEVEDDYKSRSVITSVFVCCLFFYHVGVNKYVR